MATLAGPDDEAASKFDAVRPEPAGFVWRGCERAVALAEGRAGFSLRG